MATKTWQGASGSWDEAGNWQPSGVPSTSDDAFVNLRGAADTISGNGSVASFSVEGATGPGVVGDLTITGTIATGAFTDIQDYLTIAPGAELLATGTADAYGDAVTVNGTLEDSAYNGNTASVTVTGSGALWKTIGDVFNTGILVTDNGRLDAAAVIIQPALGPGGVVNANIMGLDTEPLFAFADSSGDGPSVINGNVQDVLTFSVAAGATLEINGNTSASRTERPALSGGGLLVVNGTFTVDATSIFGSTLELNGTIADPGGTIELVGNAVLSLGPQAAPEGGPVRVTEEAGLGIGDTIFAAGAPVFAVLSSSGALTFVNGSAESTLNGGFGSATVFGGSGGGVFFGGASGHNVIVAEAGAATIGGGGDGDQLWANGSANDLIAAASGNETLGAGSSSGNDSLFGGSGNDVMVLGAGADYAQIGTGNATMFAGTGPDLFAAFKGHAGGNDIISGFKKASDHIALNGYAATPRIVSHHGSTTITLSDHTEITLLGVRSLNPNAFV